MLILLLGVLNILTNWHELSIISVPTAGYSTMRKGENGWPVFPFSIFGGLTMGEIRLHRDGKKARLVFRVRQGKKKIPKAVVEVDHNDLKAMEDAIQAELDRLRPTGTS